MTASIRAKITLPANPEGPHTMNSLLYGLALIAMVLIMRWYIDNDGAGQNDGSAGLLAMLTGKPKPPASTGSPTKRSFRRKG